MNKTEKANRNLFIDITHSFQCVYIYFSFYGLWKKFLVVGNVCMQNYMLRQISHSMRVGGEPGLVDKKKEAQKAMGQRKKKKGKC